VLTLRPGDDVTLLLVSEETGGALSCGEYAAQPASAGPPPHSHPDADETFYVLDGAFTMRVGDQTVQAGAGAVVFVPRGVLHSVANLGTVPARLLYVYAPAGIERYWEELVATQVRRGPLDAATIRAIAAKHGTIQPPPPVSP
jgi:mannose-6-phosphate isomerase-like protein (cupin superfamily)